MRRFDKKKHIERLNQRLNEDRFSWDGNYANEDIDESMGDDLEIPLDEEDCGCSLNQPEPTDVKVSQWFSKEDGERTIDNKMN